MPLWQQTSRCEKRWRTPESPSRRSAAPSASTPRPFSAGSPAGCLIPVTAGPSPTSLGFARRPCGPTSRLGAVSSMIGTSEILAAYAHRADVPSHVWHDLFDQAKTQIDLLGYAMLFLPEANPRLIDQLKEKAAAGCVVRIAL